MSLYSVLIALGALLPSAGVAFLFYVIMKSMLVADRSERLAHSKWAADQELLRSRPRPSDNNDEIGSAF